MKRRERKSRVNKLTYYYRDKLKKNEKKIYIQHKQHNLVSSRNSNSRKTKQMGWYIYIYIYVCLNSGWETDLVVRVWYIDWWELIIIIFFLKYA